ncbi:hypothetical protein N9R04_06085 [Staphylococcus sp. SQ8-PEA]|uniref:Mid2-like cell wall stress sensor domain protein n=1 Tax=Staphylococcus marylandisciuri TaxID=2981529 RepID=A0ABT2QQQ8_9STAP|nr:hypothetical protein [Staphylococcus marylandisciuri]MCU5746285.1 hypothetical protein [Staphylococcus marylandisciuri]
MGLISSAVIILFIIFLVSTVTGIFLLENGNKRKKFVFEVNILSKFMCVSFIILSLILVIIGHFSTS